MSNVSNTNLFFSDNAYTPLKKFAVSPFFGWEVKEEDPEVIELKAMIEEICLIPMPNIKDILIKMALSPLLIPATLVTTSMALVASVFVAFCHIISLAASATIDLVEECTNNKSMSL